jgi:hypothetical protein
MTPRTHFIICSLCRDVGHEAQQCPTSIVCSHCKQNGHLVNSCNTYYQQQRVPPGIGLDGKKAVVCERCPYLGHETSNCRTTLRPCCSLPIRLCVCEPTNCEVCQVDNHTTEECRRRCEVCDLRGHTAALCKTPIEQLECRWCHIKGSHTLPACEDLMRVRQEKEGKYARRSSSRHSVLPPPPPPQITDFPPL